MSITLIIAAGTFPLARCSSSRLDQRQLMADSSFERLRSGDLAPGSPNTGWEVQRVGRQTISEALRVECVRNRKASRSGEQCVVLSIPGHTSGFEYVTIGQRIPIAPDYVYSVSAWVRWPDGPDHAPQGAARTSGHRSAIVSFWARMANGTGSFAGRDVWLFDNRWRRLTFRFCAPGGPDRALVYVSLLPNQRPAATTVVVDDFTMTSLPAPQSRRYVHKVVTKDPSLSSQTGPTITPPWSFSTIGGRQIEHTVCEEDGNRFVRIAMPSDTPGLASAQIWQHIELRRGTRYETSCRMRWENYTDGDRAPIANFGLYDERTDTWYGPVDIRLHPTTEWRTYRFTHVPPSDGVWKLYIGLNGWGNNGRALTVTIDDVSCRVLDETRPRS